MHVAEAYTRQSISYLVATALSQKNNLSGYWLCSYCIGGLILQTKLKLKYKRAEAEELTSEVKSRQQMKFNPL